MKHGYFTSHLKANYSQWNGTTLNLPQKRNAKHPQPRKSWQLSSGTERRFFFLILCLRGPHQMLQHILKHWKRLDVLFRTEDKGSWYNCLQWQCKDTHYKSNAAVVAVFQLGGFIQSCPQPRPCSHQFRFVFGFKETSGPLEVSQWWTGEQQSHHVVVCLGSRILWHRSTKTHTQAKQMPWQRW